MSRRRVLRQALAAGAATGLPYTSPAQQRIFDAASRDYSRRAVRLVERSLVIDMLGPLSLDFTSKPWATSPTPEAVKDFHASGITGFHHAVGISGPDAYDEALLFMAEWQGYVGRGSDVFMLVSQAVDLDRAKAIGRLA